MSVATGGSLSYKQDTLVQKQMAGTFKHVRAYQVSRSRFGEAGLQDRGSLDGSDGFVSLTVR